VRARERYEARVEEREEAEKGKREEREGAEEGASAGERLHGDRGKSADRCKER
jgi:hypothetical protein